MRYIVNENCIGCGFCEGACPHAFHMNDSGLAEAIDADVAAAFEADAESAMLGCPVGAIEQDD